MLHATAPQMLSPLLNYWRPKPGRIVPDIRSANIFREISKIYNQTKTMKEREFLKSSLLNKYLYKDRTVQWRPTRAIASQPNVTGKIDCYSHFQTYCFPYACNEMITAEDVRHKGKARSRRLWPGSPHPVLQVLGWRIPAILHVWVT